MVRRPWFLKSKRVRTTEKIIKVRSEAKQRHRRVTSNGHEPRKEQR